MYEKRSGGKFRCTDGIRIKKERSLVDLTAFGGLNSIGIFSPTREPSTDSKFKKGACIDAFNTVCTEL